MRSNQDNRTIKSFGEEWKRFNQDKLGKEESEKIFNKYFSSKDKIPQGMKQAFGIK